MRRNFDDEDEEWNWIEEEDDEDDFEWEEDEDDEEDW